MRASRGQRHAPAAAHISSRVACGMPLVAVLVIGALSRAVIAEAASSGYEQTIEQLSDALVSVQTLAKQVAPYDAVFHRDPMRAVVNEQGELVSSAGLRGGLSVQGIIWSDQHPLAVVDDELVAQGEAVGPYTIVEIRPDGVVARYGENTISVPLDRGIEPPASQALPTPPSPHPAEAGSP